MARKTRIILIVVVGTLVGGLVVALSFPDSKARFCWAWDDLMTKLGVRCSAPRNACIANLNQIDGAKAFWAAENKKSKTDTPTATDLYGKDAHIPEEPKCPRGGTYVIGSVQQKPRCSIPGHTL